MFSAHILLRYPSTLSLLVIEGMVINVWWKVDARNEGKGLDMEADCWQNPGLETERLRGANPNSRKSKLWDGRKKADRCREAVLCDCKRGNPSSWPPTPWRALREGELPLCSSDFKLEERCSSSRRAPLPRPRPALRCLNFVYFSTGGETNREFWKRLNTLLGEGVSSDKIRTWTKFCSLISCCN